MNAKVRSVIGHAGRGLLIDIECSFSNSLPGIVIVGSAAKSVDEAKERLRAAFAGSAVNLPRKRITLNLAPADIPKTDSGVDLGMAAAILAASQQIKLDNHPVAAFIGELGLEGSIRGVRGIIGKLISARDQGVKEFFIAQDNLGQAQLVPHVRLHPLKNLPELTQLLDGTLHQDSAIDTKEGRLIKAAQRSTNDPFTDIVGQAMAKRALAIAAAGGHNVLFNGPPGTGKTMLAKTLPDLLPPLNQDEVLEVSQLHSLAAADFDQIITGRPFRAPHHSASHVSITGGGHNLRPGEISLSHRGVLFLDELPEFNRLTLESLRQPLEDRTISVARARETVDYPANFILVATANPCPCGYYGTTKPCQCQPYQIQRYQQRLSGPILDRIDIFANVHEVEHRNLLQKTSSSSDDIVGQISRARAAQAKRFSVPSQLNAGMTNSDIKRLVRLAPAAKTTLDEAASKLDLSARSYMRTIKLARTIADLEQSVSVELPHLTEALQFRPQRTLL